LIAEGHELRFLKVILRKRHDRRKAQEAALRHPLSAIRMLGSPKRRESWKPRRVLKFAYAATVRRTTSFIRDAHFGDGVSLTA
jgi:hypothetical protein